MVGSGSDLDGSGSGSGRVGPGSDISPDLDPAQVGSDRDPTSMLPDLYPNKMGLDKDPSQIGRIHLRIRLR